MSTKLSASDLRSKSKSDLEQNLIDLRKEQFALKMSKMTDENIKVHQFKALKRNIARIKTVLAEM